MTGHRWHIKIQKDIQPVLRQKCMPFCRSEGIFPGRLIEESLELTVCVVSNGIAVSGLALVQCFFQSHCKGSRSGRMGITRLRAAFFPLCLRSLRNYLNPVHLEIRKFVCCVNPSLAAYFNGAFLVLMSYIYDIGRNCREVYS